MLSRANFQKLFNRYQELKKNIPNVLNFDDLFQQIENTENLPAAIDDLYPYVRMILGDLNAIYQQAKKLRLSSQEIQQRAKNYLAHPNIVKAGEKVVKALDKGNPLSSRAKKYLGLGIAATIFGLLWIPALVLGGVFLAPLTAFTVTYTTGLLITTTSSIAVSVWGLALGIAGLISAVGSVVGIVKTSKNPSIGLRLFGNAFASNEILTFGVYTLMVVAGVFLLPFAPLIAGALCLKKAHTLSKAPQGLALALTNSTPALAKKMHYGDLAETYDAKIRKANEKLAAFYRSKDATFSANDNNRKYIEEGIKFYKKRVAVLHVELKIHQGKMVRMSELTGRKQDRTILRKENINLVKARKADLMAAKQMADQDYQQLVPINERHEKTKIRFFDVQFDHIEHAQKVEKTQRAKR